MVWNFKRQQGLLSIDHGLQRTTGLSPAAAQLRVNPKGLQGDVTGNPAGFVLLPSLGLFLDSTAKALKLP